MREIIDLNILKDKPLNDRFRRFYQIAGITLRVESDIPIEEETFVPKFKLFEVGSSGQDQVRIRHHFSLHDLSEKNLGEKVYDSAPWTIYRKESLWIYQLFSRYRRKKSSYIMGIFNFSHDLGRIFHDNENNFVQGQLQALTMFPTDQVLLARLLADRNGCFIHSSGVSFKGKGFLFVGHSEAGKSTIAGILKEHAEIFCDDRNIIREWPEGFRIHGTWSHGDLPDVSPGEAPFKGMFFLNKAKSNRIDPIKDRMIIIKKILACLIKPMVSVDWWEKSLSLVEKIARDVPCYDLYFDKSDKIIDLLKEL